MHSSKSDEFRTLTRNPIGPHVVPFSWYRRRVAGTAIRKGALNVLIDQVGIQSDRRGGSFPGRADDLCAGSAALPATQTPATLVRPHRIVDHPATLIHLTARPVSSSAFGTKRGRRRRMSGSRSRGRAGEEQVVGDQQDEQQQPGQHLGRHWVIGVLSTGVWEPTPTSGRLEKAAQAGLLDMPRQLGGLTPPALDAAAGTGSTLGPGSFLLLPVGGSGP